MSAGIDHGAGEFLVDQGGRLKNMSVGTLQNLSYLYDAVGNIKQITNSTASETNSYGYDSLNRLTSWDLNGTTETYSYETTTGNLDVKAGVDLTHIGSTQKYWYDANGSQTTRVIGSDTFNLIYDAENRLVEVKKNSVSMVTFTYDGDGKRVKSTINGTTTLFAGARYEINTGTKEVTKYYFAGTASKDSIT